VKDHHQVLTLGADSFFGNG